MLVLAAFLVRAAIPAGYMAEMHADTGLITIELCSSDGSHKTVEISVPTDRPASKQPKTDCAFGMGTAAVLAEGSPIVQAAEAYVFRAALAETPTLPARAVWRAHAPPTGPPSLT